MDTTTQTPWDIYPRPQLRRDSYISLNGTWDFAVSDTPALPQRYDRTITVPFCPESTLSGIGQHFPEGCSLFYRRSFSLPDAPGLRTLLHIGAADQLLECYVNQNPVGMHTGGYTAMTFDITDFLSAENELVLRVQDDLRDTAMPRGKQSRTPGGMWYTPVSGVWQSIWLERVPDGYIHALTIRTDCTRAVIDTGDPRHTGTVAVQTPYGTLTVPLIRGHAEIVPSAPRLWQPDDPYLYSCTVTAGADRVRTYFAMRTLEIRKIDGVSRLCLNGAPIFLHGVLDQGYWADGLYTPPSPGCYEADISAIKRLGFNTLRKHAKVEPEEFYYQCDRLGMLVIQDMVSSGQYRYLRDTVLPTLGLQRRSDRHMHRDARQREIFLAAMHETVAQLQNHPSIVCWTIFNEGWGQFDGSRVYQMLRAQDSSRFICTASGWFRGVQSDLDSRHIYFNQWFQLRAGKKPLVLTEFGGICLPVAGHLFRPGKAYGYQSSKNAEQYREKLLALYHTHILPAAERGLCAAIYTQLSDVEEEINGLLTYDRAVCKVRTADMRPLAQALQAAVRESAPSSLR